MSDTMATTAPAVDFEALGFASGATLAHHSGAYYDGQEHRVVGLDSEELRDLAAKLSPQVVGTYHRAHIAWQDGAAESAERDPQYAAWCERFAAGFEQGYTLALI